MTRFILAFGLIFTMALSGSPAFAAKRILTCAVNVFPAAYKGIRVNIILDSQDRLKATVTEGRTMNTSGTYRVVQTRTGYEGEDRFGNPFKLFLNSSVNIVENNYIRGISSELVYAVIRTADGTATLRTKRSDGFVCGKQIRPFGN